MPSGRFFRVSRSIRSRMSWRRMTRRCSARKVLGGVINEYHRAALTTP
jgi:hypothetical protein